MEKQIVEQALMNLQNLLPEDSKQNKEISIYGYGKVTSKGFADSIIKIKKAFPELSKEWFDILETMLDDERFTDKRLIRCS